MQYNITWETFSQKIIHKIWWICESTVWHTANLFLFDVQIKVHQNMLKIRCLTLSFILYKAFSKNNKRSGTNLPSSFSALQWKDNVSLFIFYKLTKFHCLVAYTFEILGNMVIAIVSYPDCDVINFEINLTFLVKLFFLYDQKIKTKI